MPLRGPCARPSPLAAWKPLCWTENARGGGKKWAREQFFAPESAASSRTASGKHGNGGVADLAPPRTRVSHCILRVSALCTVRIIYLLVTRSATDEREVLAQGLPILEWVGWVRSLFAKHRAGRRTHSLSASDQLGLPLDIIVLRVSKTTVHLVLGCLLLLIFFFACGACAARACGHCSEEGP